MELESPQTSYAPYYYTFLLDMSVVLCFVSHRFHLVTRYSSWLGMQITRFLQESLRMNSFQKEPDSQFASIRNF